MNVALMTETMVSTDMTAGQRSAPTDAESRWRVLLSRDQSADGSFVYAVATTGIYCRPTCSARPPRREHVSFFDSPALAERGGFRACLRCRPNEPPLLERQAAAVAELCRYIDSCEEPPKVNDLAARTEWSPSHLHRVFRAVMGVSPKTYIAARRAERLRTELRSSSSVTGALYGAGFGSSGRFYDAAPAALGMAPSTYRKGAPGEVIRWAVNDCSLGKVLVAATARGICAVLLGDESLVLHGDLSARFPRAQIVEAAADLAAWIAQVVRFIDDSETGFPLPLDVRGSAFQTRVWQALREIPLGSTRTYAEIACDLGDPNAVRAVAGACAQNPLAVAIPCHRVVRSDGALAGYRWGIERKKQLLQREANRRRRNPDD